MNTATVSEMSDDIAKATPLVYVVEDDQAVLHSLSWSLQEAGHMVAGFESPTELIRAYNPKRPGCLLLDLQLPELNGLELLGVLRAEGCLHPFIMITGHGDVTTAVEAMRLGAIDFIEKPYRRERPLESVQTAIESDQRSRENLRAREVFEALVSKLTPREREVMDLVVQGRLTKQIARDLDISARTVEVHRSRITHKMKVESVAQLVSLVMLYRLNNPGTTF